LLKRAVELGIKIVTIDWLKSVWETNLKEPTPATDSIFDKYKCPVFLNLIVTSTNLNKRQKDDIKRIINSHGGVCNFHLIYIIYVIVLLNKLIFIFIHNRNLWEYWMEQKLKLSLHQKQVA
jgi:hypothetical protein